MATSKTPNIHHYSGGSDNAGPLCLSAPDGFPFEGKVPRDVFSAEQQESLLHALAQLTHTLQGRKIEEGDWKRVYCEAKGIPLTGWSNLPFGDIIHEGVGVEQKLLGTGEVKPAALCGKTVMHPAATRAFRIDSTRSAENAKTSVLNQYGDLIENFRRKVAEDSGGKADIRVGWLLYHQDYAQYLYFEEDLEAPDPSEYRATWVIRETRGERKGSKNLWIYEKKAGVKRFSVTTVAGAKIQPYLDIPKKGTKGLYVFDIFDAYARQKGRDKFIIWGLESTYLALLQVLKESGYKSLDEYLKKIEVTEIVEAAAQTKEPNVGPILVSAEAYRQFKSLGGKTDDERLRKVLRFLEQKL